MPKNKQLHKGGAARGTFWLGFVAAFSVNRQSGGALRRFIAFVDKCNKTAETTAYWSLEA
jgi:hypothetical protein